MTANVRFDKAGGDAELLGLYFADQDSSSSTVFSVTTRSPTASRNVLYEGALQGWGGRRLCLRVVRRLHSDAHTVWVGDVLIRAAAEGTDTYEANRNLILTDHARADSIPGPRNRDRGIRGSRPRERDGKIRRRPVVLPASSRLPEPWHDSWWFVVSSTRSSLSSPGRLRA